MTIRVKKTNRFTIVPNALINDQNLDWESRGLLIYLISKPDGWQVNIAYLVKVGPAGREKIKSILAKLEAAGYIQRIRSRDKFGRWEWISEVHESPIPREIEQQSVETMCGKPVYGETVDGLPVDGETVDGKPAHIISTDPTSTDKASTDRTNPERVTRNFGEFSSGLEINPEPEPEGSPLATTSQPPSSSNPDIEITNIPPASAEISPQEALLPLAQVSKDTETQSSGLTARFSGGEDLMGDRYLITGSWRSRKPLLDNAIKAYNNSRHSSWGAAPAAPSSSLYLALDKILKRLVADEVADPEGEFVQVVACATLWVGSSEWHTKPEFDNRNLTWLIGQPDRVLKYADQWRSKPESAMVGAAIKITNSAGEIQYFDLNGKPQSKSFCKVIWWGISDAAIKGESITEAQKDWANYYFPNHDIYVGAENLT